MPVIESKEEYDFLTKILKGNEGATMLTGLRANWKRGLVKNCNGNIFYCIDKFHQLFKEVEHVVTVSL